MAKTRSDTQRAATQAQKGAFLTALREEVYVTQAAKAAGVGRSTVYAWREGDEAFAAEWDEIDTANVERMEREMFRRGVEGWNEPVWHQGVEVGTVRKFSDQLLMFGLKARRPNVYRDRATVEHTGEGGGPVRVESKPDLSKLSAEELRELHGLLSKADADAASRR